MDGGRHGRRPEEMNKSGRPARFATFPEHAPADVGNVTANRRLHQESHQSGV